MSAISLNRSFGSQVGATASAELLPLAAMVNASDRGGFFADPSFESVDLEHGTFVVRPTIEGRSIEVARIVHDEDALGILPISRAAEGP